MMFLCQKRPALSQAVKLEETTESIAEVINFTYGLDAKAADMDIDRCVINGGVELNINEGYKMLAFGYYIVKDGKGVLHICTPYQFDQNYESLEGETK